MKNPVLNFLEEATFHIGIGTFLLFYLCVPFLILERKAVSLKDAMQKSVAMMQKEWKLFLRQVLFFLVIRLGANLLASMWSYILDNSSFPDMLLSAFYVLYLSPCFILVQAKFYQEILKKNEILGRAETPEPEESVVTEQNRDASSVQEERNVVAEQEALSPSEEQHEAEEESAVTEQEQHALSQPEEVSTEWRDESVRETEELQQKEDIAEPKEENTEQEEEKAEKQEEEQSGKPEEEAVQEEEKVEKQEEKEEQAKEQAAKPEEKKEEELSFEEARKRYTDYKEES